MGGGVGLTLTEASGRPTESETARISRLVQSARTGNQDALRFLQDGALRNGEAVCFDRIVGLATAATTAPKIQKDASDWLAEQFSSWRGKSSTPDSWVAKLEAQVLANPKAYQELLTYLTEQGLTPARVVSQLMSKGLDFSPSCSGRMLVAIASDLGSELKDRYQAIEQLAAATLRLDRGYYVEDFCCAIRQLLSVAARTSGTPYERALQAACEALFAPDAQRVFRSVRIGPDVFKKLAETASSKEPSEVAPLMMAIAASGEAQSVAIREAALIAAAELVQRARALPKAQQKPITITDESIVAVLRDREIPLSLRAQMLGRIAAPDTARLALEAVQAQVKDPSNGGRGVLLEDKKDAVSILGHVLQRHAHELHYTLRDGVVEKLRHHRVASYSPLHEAATEALARRGWLDLPSRIMDVYRSWQLNSV